VADRGDTSDAEPGEGVGLARCRPPQRRFAQDEGKTRGVDPVAAAQEHEVRLKAFAAVRDPDERLDDLAQVGADGRGRLLRGGRPALERDDVEGDPLARGSLKDAPMGRMEGHGLECTIGGQSKNGTGERHSALRVRERPQTLGT